MTWFPFSIAQPWAFAGGLLIVLAAVAGAVWRRAAMARGTGLLCAAGLVLLALAAGGLAWRRTASAEVVVMVDLSASTRGAAFRERPALDARLRELLPGVPYRVVYFSDRVSDAAPGGATRLADMESSRTVFDPPADAVAVVVFTDGRFDIPTGRSLPPAYLVADPKLDRPGDAAVTRIDRREGRVAVGMRNQAGGRRVLTFDGVSGERAEELGSTEGAEVTVARDVADGAVVVTARLDDGRARGDLWPENDVLSIGVLPTVRERWYVSGRRGGDAPAGWVRMAPSALPADAARYLSPEVIVLDDVAAGDLSGAQLARVEQYLRDLGGGLVIAGGERAFGGGMYAGTVLEGLSPLASAPPAPATHWVLLADASGSMSQRAVGGVANATATYWQIAAGALAGLLDSLPPRDPVSVGSFSSDVRWWSTGRSAAQTAKLSLPPADVSPSGPTNLAAALERVAREAPAGLASELLVISDADVTIDRPADIAGLLSAKKVRLHILAVGGDERARGYAALEAIARATGGTIIRQADARRWAADVRRLLEAAWPRRTMTTATEVEFLADLSRLPGRAVSPWQRTWAKEGATVAAGSRERLGADGNAPLGAWWQWGAGRVAALGFSPSDAEVEAVARLVGRTPRDPRFSLTWETGAPRLGVRVEATEGPAPSGRTPPPANGWRLLLELWPDSDLARKSVTTHSIPQTAPGRYELTVQAPQARTFAAVRLLPVGPSGDSASQVLDRAAIPARYAQEFEGLGNDYAAMGELARRSGGYVIGSSPNKPIDVRRPRRQVDLSAWLAAAGAALLALGVARWRWG